MGEAELMDVRCAIGGWNYGSRAALQSRSGGVSGDDRAGADRHCKGIRTWENRSTWRRGWRATPLRRWRERG